MTTNNARGLGKCANSHVGSFGYATRPDEAYPFCSQCGLPMVWQCAACESPMPDDQAELITARFCRHCGAPYFGAETPDDPQAAPDESA